MSPTQFVDQLRDVGAVTVVAHAIGEYDPPRRIHHEIAAQLEHVRCQAQKSFALEYQAKIAPVQRGRKHGAEKVRPTQSPTSVDIPRRIQDERVW